MLVGIEKTCRLVSSKWAIFVYIGYVRVGENSWVRGCEVNAPNDKRPMEGNGILPWHAGSIFASYAPAGSSGKREGYYGLPLLQHTV